MTKTAIIVDDEISGRESLERLLGYCENIKIIGIYGVPEEAVESIIQLNPAILFLDVEMPRLSGFDIVDLIREKGINPMIIFTTGYNQYAIKAIKAQAFDYLLKPIVLDELKETLSRISTFGIIETNQKQCIFKMLSSRECEILELILLGKTSREIGDVLFISKTTVDTHRRNILDKTGAKNTAELISKMLV